MARKKNLPSRVVDYDSLSLEFKSIYDKLYAEYDKKNIPELREEAKRMNVESPTTLSKKALVKRMTDWVMCDYLPPVYTESELWELHKGNGVQERGVFENRGGSLRLDNDITVPLKLARETNLRDGDLVDGKVAYVTGTKTLVDVDTVDGEDPHAARRWFSEIDLAPRRKFELPSGEVRLKGLETGERVMIPDMTLEQAIEFCKMFENSVGLFVGLEPECEYKVRREIPSGRFIIAFDSAAADAKRLARLALSRAKRLGERGRDTVMVIYGFDRIEDRDIEHAIFGAGRCFEEGSLSILADVDPQKDKGIFAKASTRII